MIRKSDNIDIVIFNAFGVIRVSGESAGRDHFSTRDMFQKDIVVSHLSEPSGLMRVELLGFLKVGQVLVVGEDGSGKL